MDSLSGVSEELAEIEGQIADIFRALSNGFQKLEKIKDCNRQSRQLEELTDKMRECKRLIKEFDREVKDAEYKNDSNTNKMLSERKQSMIKELNSYVALKKQCASNFENKRVDLFDGPGEGFAEENVLLASNMTNQQLMDHGNQMMDQTDEAIERSKKVVHDTIDVGTETAAALKAQTEQMSRIVNELDSIHFSIKKASKLVKEIGRQVNIQDIKSLSCHREYYKYNQLVQHSNRRVEPTRRGKNGIFATCLFQLVNPNNKDIRDIPGLAPPAPTRKLLWSSN